MDRIAIEPVQGPIRGAIRPPGSKSITNRALVCAALADGVSTLAGALDSDDTRVMIDSLDRLGIHTTSQEAGTALIVHGSGGNIPATSADLFVGNSGTTIRFLTGLCTLGSGDYRLDGLPRMRERPIGDLLTALEQLGARVDCEGRPGFPPIIVHAGGLAGGQAVIRGDISSQFLSAVLMAAPYAAQDVELIVEGPLVSRPYIKMTLALMESYGIRAMVREDLSRFRIRAPQKYIPQQYAIEPDASAASYFWAAAAITGGEVTVTGLTRGSLQGDVALVDCLQQMGCTVRYEPDGIIVSGRAERGIDVNMNGISDTVQTLAAVALFAAGPTTITGIGHIRHKETDRIGDLARELRKLGAGVDERPDGVRIVPPASPSSLHGAEIETYNDHRMAMSLALAGLRIPGVEILDPCCTAKTYPKFFDDLTRLAASRG